MKNVQLDYSYKLINYRKGSRLHGMEIQEINSKYFQILNT